MRWLDRLHHGADAGATVSDRKARVERVDVRVATGTKVLLVFLGLFTLGMLPLLLWSIARWSWPRTLDVTGVTLRNGRHLPWSELTEVRRATVLYGALPAAKTINLIFGKKGVMVWPRHLKNRAEVLTFLDPLIANARTVTK